MMSDFSTSSTFAWSRLEEGNYDLRVSVEDRANPDSGSETLNFTLNGWSGAGQPPVVVPTGHPLVALLSHAPCPPGVAMRVRFFAVNDGPPGTVTPLKACDGLKTMNFLVAGMREDTDYILLPELRLPGGNIVASLPNPFRTGFADPVVQDFAVATPSDQFTSVDDGVALVSSILRPPEERVFYATDLAGNPIWYMDKVALQGQGNGAFRLTRPVDGGTFLFIGIRDDLVGTVLQEVDLLGNVVRETTAEVVNDQLANMGEEPILSFHHDATRLPNGHTAVLAYSERTLEDVQGPGPVDILGDTIVVLDENFQLVWAWDSFDKLDPTEVAILGETCTPAQPGCPGFLTVDIINDWTHANSVAYSPADGHLVISVRHLDAAFKVDFADGAGTGDVVWRLGRGGDFTIDADPGEVFPWFSHQHDTTYRDGFFVVYDNGNTRVSELGAGENSRGQVFVLDEPGKVAHLVGNFDLGSYNAAVGSVGRLSNGNFFFTNGFIGFGAEHQMLEVRPNGDHNWALGGPDIAYRGYRMYSLYWGGKAALGKMGAGF
jgi:hypothetical protein